MKDFEYYSDCDVEWPNRLDFMTVYGYLNGERVFSVRLDNLDKTMALYEGKPVIEKVVDNDAYANAVGEYRKARAAREEEFRQDLFKDFEVENNPKRELAYEMAYERCHSEGYWAVYDEFAYLVPLIEE